VLALALAVTLCANCHPDHVHRQSQSHHARALRPILNTPLPQLLMERPLLERSGAAFDYKIIPTGLAVTARMGKDKVSAVLEWAFGAGAQGITPVGRHQGRWFEHRISWYATPGRPYVTIGHPVAPSPSPAAALGIIQPEQTIFRCFNCHATSVKVALAGPDLSEMQPGVTCERCHGPGEAHARAPQAKQSILNPARFPAKAIVEICAECHRAPQQPARTPEIKDPVSVRFQPVGFLASRCFQSAKDFSCLTCHDPHENARSRNDGFYTSRCLGCHAPAAPARSDCPRPAQQQCVQCHMPQTSPLPHLRFTDHRIRVP